MKFVIKADTRWRTITHRLKDISCPITGELEAGQCISATTLCNKTITNIWMLRPEKEGENINCPCCAKRQSVSVGCKFCLPPIKDMEVLTMPEDNYKHLGRCQFNKTESDVCKKQDCSNCMELEVWASIPQYEKMYLVSTRGRIKVLLNTPYIMQPELTDEGYLKVKLFSRKDLIQGKHFFIHELMSKVFLFNKKGKQIV
jgi:hypothetical protein